MRRTYKKVEEFMGKIARDHTDAYAAQAAYFLMLSLIPAILFLITLVQFTPVTKADVITAVVQVMPESFQEFMVSIIYQVYNTSQAVLPLTAITALWSAGRGVLSMSTGLNCIYESVETRNYLFIRIRAILYTLLFLVSIAISLVLLVFGNSLSNFINIHAPILSQIMNLLIRIRGIVSVIILTGVFMLVYKFLPNRRTKFIQQLPGALFTAVGWVAASFIFSVYINVFTGFSDMYGSLTTIVLLMLWLYSCMYIMLLGGHINVYIEKYLFENGDTSVPINPQETTKEP